MRKFTGRNSLFIVSLVVAASILLLCAAAQAQNADEPPPHPAISTIYGNTGLWKVYSAPNLPKYKGSFNVFYDRINRNPGFLTIGTVGVSGAFGITDWLELGINVELNRHILARRQDQLSFGQQALGLFGTQAPGATPLPTELMPGTLLPRLRLPATRTGTLTGRAGYYNDLPWIGDHLGSNGIGTVNVGLKINPVSEERGAPVGLSVTAYGVIPTHRSVNFLRFRPSQTGDWIIGTDLVLSKYIGNMAELDLNVGFRDYFDPGPGDRQQMELSNSVPLGFGIVIPRSTRIQLMSEITAEVYTGDHTPVTSFDARDPVDGTIGFRAWLTKGLALSGGYRHPLNQFGGDKHGFVADLSYSTGGREKAPPTPPSLTCMADPTEVLAGAGTVVNLSAQGVSSTGKLVTYEWTTTGGTIEGSGPAVRLRTDNMQPGTYTQTVKATDLPGNSADCSTRVTVTAPPPPPPAPKPPTVTCSADRPSVQAGEIVSLNARANSPDNRPLRYEWTTTEGRVEGTGATVRFDTTGLRPGTYSIRVKVSDDRNLSAECTMNVTVTAPPAPPPAPPRRTVQLLGTCEFKAGSSRVDNVCKAKLDDAALALRNQPDDTLAVVGFADTREARAARLADARAANGKAYLVKEKGIADSRVEARHGTNARGPANRKLEIYQIPRGETLTIGEVVAKPPAGRVTPASRAAAKAPAKKSAQVLQPGHGGPGHATVAQSAERKTPEAGSLRTLIAAAR